MSIITVNGQTFNGNKSVYLNDILKLRNHNGDRFTENVRWSTVKTSCGHVLWFAEINGEWNHFYNDGDAHYIRENNLHGKWKDPTDKAAEKFAAGEIAIRSAICRRSEKKSNRYYGEFQLIEVNDDFRIWKRVADEVEMETCA